MPASHTGAAQRSSFPSSLRDNAPRSPSPGAPEGDDLPRLHSSGGAQTGGRCSSPTWPLVRLAASPRCSTATRQVTGAALGPPSVLPSLLPSPPLTPPSGRASRHRSPPPRQCGGRAGGGRAGGASRHHSRPLRACPSPPRRVRTARLPPQGRPALTAAGPGASTPPSGTAIGRVYLCKGRPGQERQNGLEHGGAGLREGQRPRRGWGGPGCRRSLTARVGAAVQESGEAHVSQPCPPKISPLQACETAQFKKKKKKVGFVGFWFFFFSFSELEAPPQRLKTRTKMRGERSRAPGHRDRGIPRETKLPEPPGLRELERGIP
ncbi:uncharacterized protein LOC143694528 isoform X1 [Agelaius phoeniceus]|uniref:uncharacterized protein LOC143694528 isoform X1 n=1 Tax=Agelaius phoeniceus TaxID=39638 RepID=UPI004055057D